MNKEHCHQELVCLCAYMLGYTHDKWTEKEQAEIRRVINKYDENDENDVPQRVRTR